ncbi:hypothetical protein CSB20_02675, partial [bacterium DOLZORAL124_64_63]
MIRLVLRSLRRHLTQGRVLFLFTVVGVALGVASVTAIQTLNQGALQAFDGSVRAVSGQAQLSVLGTSRSFAETHLVTVLADPAVAAAWPLVRLDAVIEGRGSGDSSGNTTFVDLVGADLLAPVRWPVEREETPQDPFAAVLEAILQPGWLALTPDFAAEQGLCVGDTLRLA